MAASKVLASAVYEATPRDPLVLCGVVVSMALLGAIAGWLLAPFPAPPPAALRQCTRMRDHGSHKAETIVPVTSEDHFRDHPQGMDPSST
jgi:hypothetical protein